MPSQNIKEQCLNFLEKFNFARIEWDGTEMTAFTDSGEPMGRSEFVANSDTTNAFDELEKAFSEKELRRYSLSK